MKHSAFALFLILTGAVFVGNLCTDAVRAYFVQQAVEEAAAREAFEEVGRQIESH